MQYSAIFNLTFKDSEQNIINSYQIYCTVYYIFVGHSRPMHSHFPTNHRRVLLVMFAHHLNDVKYKETAVLLTDLRAAS